MRTGGWARVAIAAVAAAMLAACAPGQDPVVVGSSQPPQPDSPLATVAPAVTAATDAPAADPVEPPEVEPSGPVESAAGVVTPTTRGSQVGDGRPESCTSAALVRAVRAGGDVTFDCGGQMAIVLDETLTVCNSVGCEPGGAPMALVRILGGGDITIAGAGERSLLYANSCEESLGTLEGPCEGRTTPRVVLDGLSLIDGSAQAGPRGVAGPLDLDELPGGGAVAMRGGRLSLRDVFFTGNSCGDVDRASGGAVFARDMTAPFEIDGSTFAANTCARGGAIAAIRAPLIITGSSIVDNEASELGGGIFHQGFAETLEMSLSTVSGDGAPLGAGIAYDAPKGNLVVRDSRIAGNTPGAVSNTEFAGIHAVAAKIVVVRSDTD